MVRTEAQGTLPSPIAAGTKVPKKPVPSTPRRSTATKWRFGVLVLVHVLAAIHIAHWMTTGRTISPLEPSEAMDFAKYSVVNAGLIFFGLTILSTMLLGRWFCGWACHLVALQDLSRAFLIKIGLRPRPLRSRWMMVVPLIAGFYMFLWPLVYRIWIDDPLTVRSVEVTESNFWETFTDSWLIAGVTFFVTGFLAIYFLGAKGFCTYACPYGAVFGVVERISPGRIRVTDDCVQCGHCTATCTSNVDISREVHDYGMVVDPGCMKCMDCVSVCPEDALYFGFGKPALLKKPVRERRKAPKKLPLAEEAVGLGATAFAYLAWRGWRQEGDFLLSLGVATVFGFLAMTVLRVWRKREVKLPGMALKKDGSATFTAQVMSVSVLGLAAAGVYFGIVPEVSAWRAIRAESDLEGARMRWFMPNGAQLSEEERAAAETLLASAEVIDERTSRWTLHNTMRIVWASLFLGEEKKLAAALEAALAYEHAGPDPALIQSRLQLAKDDVTGAIATLEGVVTRFPAYADAALTLSNLYLGRSDVAAAEGVIERGLAANPEAHRLLASRALIALQRGEVDAAERGMREALELHPEDHAVRGLAWTAMRDLGRFGAAADLLTAGLAQEGAPIEWRADLAQVLVAAGRPAEALAEARRLRELANGDRRLLTVARAVLDAAGAPEEAAAVQAELDADAALSAPK